VIASLPVIYILVLLGSFAGICIILGMRIALRNRNVRKFVRSVTSRTESALENNLPEEKPLERPKANSRAAAIDRQKMRTFVRSAERALSRGNILEAERDYIQALTLVPTAYDVQANLAKLYLESEKYSKSEALYRELLNQCDDISFHSNLGLSYYYQGKYEEARKSYSRALEKDPKNPERNAALGRACIASERFSEAAPLLEKATARMRDTELLKLLAECYLRLGYREQALETYKKINKLEPYNEEVKEKLAALATV